jgi:hypothetical protein
MTIILTTDILKKLFEENVLKIIKKQQKNTHYYNYYFSENIGIKLYQCKVLFSNENYIVFEFDKYKNLPLLQLLRNIHNMMMTRLKSMNNYSNDIIIYEPYSETEENFTIRCNILHVKNKYFIECLLGEMKIPFNIPKKGVVLDTVVIEFKNIWENANRIAYNMEIKKLVY